MSSAGAASPAGILREAVWAGLKAVLFEQGDFASGTSSGLLKNSWMGMRATQIKLTWEFVHEREHLLKEGGGDGYAAAVRCMANFRGDKTPGWVFAVA